MVFPNAYTTTPVCSPSRAGLLTSRYGYELGIDDWINTNGKSITGLTPKLGLNAAVPTWPKVLQKAGYYSGLVGKWHVGITDESHPSQLGYNEFTGFRAGWARTINPTIEKAGIKKQYQGLTADILTEQAVLFLNRHKDKKFMLSVHYRAPHTTWLPVSESDAKPYKNFNFTLPTPEHPNLDTVRVQRMMGEYLSSVRSVDRNLGIILDELERLKLNHNTVVIFTSDHGYNMGHNGIWHKGNGHWLLKNTHKGQGNIPDDQRPNMYDTSIKVPLIVRWPNVVQNNKVNYSTVSNLDWFPTLVEIAQGQAYVNSATILRGKSFLPALLNHKKLVSNDYYAAYSTKHQSVTDMRMYSNGQYKLVKDWLNTGRDEFYDLLNDPAESVNLITSNDENIQKNITLLTQQLLNKMQQTGDPIITTSGK